MATLRDNFPQYKYKKMRNESFSTNDLINKIYYLKNIIGTDITYVSGCILSVDLDVPFCLTTFPKEWLDYYHQQEYIHVDPVVSYGLGSLKPALFSDISSPYAKSRELRLHAAERGIFRSGFVVPLRGPLVNRAMVCFSSLERPEQWKSTCVSLQAQFIQLARELHENVLAIGHFPQAEVALTARQKQCLKWASLGKTASETAMIIGITERAVRAHLVSARSVLNASNITQAVAKATALHVIF